MEPGGMDTAAGPYAPADFVDANEISPAVFDIGGNGSATPYSNAVNAIVTKNHDEIKNKAISTTNLANTWKRRFRDFMSKKNNELLAFLTHTVPHHPVLGPAELLLRKFGNPQVSPTHVSVRDIIIDVSQCSVIEDLNTALLSVCGTSPLKDYAAQTVVIYDQYKEAGDSALKAQHRLKCKLDKLDRIQGKMSVLFEIDTNDKYEPLLKANEEYLRKIFDDSQIEEDYSAVIKAYRRFLTLREMVTMTRSMALQEKEPLCSICLEDSVSYTLIPCGHTFCQTCVRRQTNHCFICRTHVKEKIKLYFS
jgi:hypothetical protein